MAAFSFLARKGSTPKASNPVKMKKISWFLRKMSTVCRLLVLLMSVHVHFAPSPPTNKKKRKFCSFLNSHGRTIVSEHYTEWFRTSDGTKYLESWTSSHFRMIYCQCLQISVERAASVRNRNRTGYNPEGGSSCGCCRCSSASSDSMV